MLTERQVRKVRALRSARKLFDGRGLYMLVAPNGGRYWRYNYRFEGKYNTLALGTYPDVSLAKARVRHQLARQLLADGIDPSAVKRIAGKRFEPAAQFCHLVPPDLDSETVGAILAYMSSGKEGLR